MYIIYVYIYVPPFPIFPLSPSVKYFQKAANRGVVLSK